MGNKDKITKRDVIEVLILLIIFISFVYGDLLIKSVDAHFALGMIFGGISALIICLKNGEGKDIFQSDRFK